VSTIIPVQNVSNHSGCTGGEPRGLGSNPIAANAGIQNTTPLAELPLLPPVASLAPPRRVPLDARFRG